MVNEFFLQMPDFHVTFRNLLHAVDLRHGTNGFTSLRKEGVLRIFFRPEKFDGFGRVWTRELGVPKASTLHLDHRSRCPKRNHCPVREVSLQAPCTFHECGRTHCANWAFQSIRIKTASGLLSIFIFKKTGLTIRTTRRYRQLPNRGLRKTSMSALGLRAFYLQNTTELPNTCLNCRISVSGSSLKGSQRRLCPTVVATAQMARM